MRVLLIHRYIWPDATPYASMLLDIGRRLSHEGHEVQILATFPSYHDQPEVPRPPQCEVIDGVLVNRVKLLSEKKRQSVRRAINAALFLSKIGAHLATHRYDVVTFSTMPPVFLGAVVRHVLKRSRRGGRYLYHCQDIYPELALHAGIVRAGVWYRWLKAIDRKTVAEAAAVVVLSPDMERTLRLREVDGANIRVINNFSLTEEGSPTASPIIRRQPGDFVALFAGNLGRFQALDNVVEAARLLSEDRRIQFYFLGDGVARQSLQRRAGRLLGKTIHFHRHVPPEEAFAAMEMADLGLVTLDSRVTRFAYPSKTMTYLAAGCRLLVSADESCELTRVVEAEDLGAWCRRGRADLLAELIRREAARSDLQSRRPRLRAFARRRHGKASVLGAWVELFRDLERQWTTDSRRHGETK